MIKELHKMFTNSGETALLQEIGNTNIWIWVGSRSIAGASFLISCSFIWLDHSQLRKTQLCQVYQGEIRPCPFCCNLKLFATNYKAREEQRVQAVVMVVLCVFSGFFCWSASCAGQALTHNQLSVPVKILLLDFFGSTCEAESIGSTKLLAPCCTSICSPDFPVYFFKWNSRTAWRIFSSKWFSSSLLCHILIIVSWSYSLDLYLQLPSREFINLKFAALQYFYFNARFYLPWGKC